jgi:hypothetical protein
MDEYDKYLYHPDGRSTIVKDEDEERQKKSEGYVESPKEYGVETCPAGESGQVGSSAIMVGFKAPDKGEQGGGAQGQAPAPEPPQAQPHPSGPPPPPPAPPRAEPETSRRRS